VFFISAIALSDYLIAFCLHITPPVLTVLLLDDGQHLMMILFTITLPLIGFSLHHLMRRRFDTFTRRLVSQLYEEKESFSDLSMLDPLTGLYNRRGLKNRLDTILENHAGSHFVLLLDIDHFKAYNDNYGHAMGDQALARVSVAIRDAVRSRDVVTRYGGEEFLVLMTNVNASIAMKLAERIRQYVVDLEIPHRFNEKVSTHVTISAGIAPIFADDFDQAVANADRALYVAKNQGRNTILAWEDLPKLTQASNELI
jgi:diguanylate cyclase (GGDEF)-like protein